MDEIKTVAEVIEQLGGDEVVAEAIGVTRNAVYNWRSRGLPPRTFFALSNLLTAKGLQASPALWGKMYRG